MTALLGASEFSHAQLVVPSDVLGAEAIDLQRTSPGQPLNLVIEATTDVDPITKDVVGGIGYYRFPRMALHERGSGSLPEGSFSPLKDYSYFDVFRHRAADTSAFQSFLQDHLIRMCQQYLHQPYARLQDLAAVSRAPWTVEFVCGLLKNIPKSPRPGLFCSQLVATIFRDGGFPLTETEPRHVTPGDIACSSQLARVTTNTRRQVAPNEELLDLAGKIEAVLPDFLDEIAAESGITADEIKQILSPTKKEAKNLHDRFTTWRIRDTLEAHKERAQRFLDVFGSLENVLMLAREIAQQVENPGAKGSGAST